MSLLRPRLGGLERLVLGASVGRSALATLGMEGLLELSVRAMSKACGLFVVRGGGILLGTVEYLLTVTLLRMEE